MNGYTKLFSSIITSTIWGEDDQTRIVWITMLASADKNGEVQASIPGLSRISGVPIEACEKALAKFLAPDPYSRTKDDEGRRIEAIDGGWAILNHRKYRDLASKDDVVSSNAERQRRHRERLKRNGEVTVRNATVTDNRYIADTDAKADSDAEAAKKTCSTPAFEEFWQAYPKRVGKGSAEKAWKLLKCNSLLPQILTAIREAKMSEAWTKEGGQYIPYPATWLNRKGWEDQLAPPKLPPTGRQYRLV